MTKKVYERKVVNFTLEHYILLGVVVVVIVVPRYIAYIFFSRFIKYIEFFMRYVHDTLLYNVLECSRYYFCCGYEVKL